MEEAKKPERYREPSNWKGYAVPCAIALLYGAISYYFILPPINGYSSGFWGWLMSVAFFYLVGIVVVHTKNGRFDTKEYKGRDYKLALGAMGVCLVVLVVGAISSATLFNARRYAGLIKVDSAVFE